VRDAVDSGGVRNILDPEQRKRRICINKRWQMAFCNLLD
jgi:hypothetical protein